MGVEAEAGGEGGEGLEAEGVEADVVDAVGGGGEAEFALVLVADVGALFDLAGESWRRWMMIWRARRVSRLSAVGSSRGSRGSLDWAMSQARQLLRSASETGKGGGAYLGLGSGEGRRRAGGFFLLFMASEKGLRWRLKQKAGADGRKIEGAIREKVCRCCLRWVGVVPMVAEYDWDLG